jgi:hypothetical protein
MSTGVASRCHSSTGRERCRGEELGRRHPGSVVGSGEHTSAHAAVRDAVARYYTPAVFAIAIATRER